MARIKTLWLFFVTSFYLVSLSSFAADDRPNIVVFLCDDLGYGDLECYGHPHIKTPNLNGLADSGIRLTNCYSAAPVCSPSRVGLLTGRSPNRAGVYDWIPPANRPTPNSRELVHMRKNEVTIPALLKAAGYSTCMSGKWHCNSRFNQSEAQPQPGDFGFDHWFGTQNNAAPSHENPTNFIRNGEMAGKLEGFSCQLVVNEAMTWLDGQQKSKPDSPFFIFIPFHEPHEPVASPQKLVKQYRTVAKSNDQAQYFANVANVDHAVGRFLKKLDQLKVRENTLVIFTSDNGPETLNRYSRANRSFGTPAPLRGMKLHVHEAGFHVPGIMSWPAKITAKQTSTVPVSSLDFLPTFCDLANTQPPADLKLDGTSVQPFLNGKPFARNEPLFWCYFNAISKPKVAMRDGDYKVLATLNDNKLPRYTNLSEDQFQKAKSAKLTDFELYDLASDPNEKNNLAKNNPAKLNEMKKKLNEGYFELLNDSHVWKK
ncbi:sulfatase-like hydrolase/transferase [Pirellulaceae bacterium]|nr:sulfatase-like hydrolase/transferase [Pirellulaceae bacterium]